MKTTKTMARSKERTQAAAPAVAERQNRQVVLAAISAAPVMIGLWSVACFVGALITSGGPLGLAQGWLQAVGL